MKITLYDGQVIDFKDKKTFNEVLDTLQKIFNTEKYQRYYGFISSNNQVLEDETTNKNLTNERWLGVKPVGKPNKENVKHTLDIIGWLLFKHNEYDCKNDIKNYKKLHKKYMSKKITDEEYVDYQRHKQNVFFDKNNILLYINQPEEKRLFKVNNNDSIRKLKAIQSIKKDIVKYDRKIQECIKEINNIKLCLKDCNITLIKEYVNIIRNYEDDIKTYKVRIQDLVQEYKYLTEKIVKLR